IKSILDVSAQVLIRVSSRVPAALCAASSIRYRQYHFIYDPKNWTEAQTYCRQTYTDLVTVDSYSTCKKSNSGVPQAWIGLYFDVIDWKWSLSDEDFYKNNEATYTNWYPGQPNGIWYTEQCVYMNLAYALWSDNYCNTLFHSVSRF
uniref:C-type lectin domain-containing protein n=1 Tax=Nothobranchius furzeri TaxID=105023 RepID=A0A8C6Q030_NOTFU